MRATESMRGLIVVAVMLGALGCATPRQQERAETIAKPGEVRAIWLASTYFSNAREEAVAKMKDALDGFASIGITDIYCFHVMRDQHEKDWDFLAVLLEKAHARDIRVHPICCPGHVYPAWKEEIIGEHPEWLIKNLAENPPCLNFALAEVREFVLGKVAEMLEYDIDGIQLDGIRFQTNQGFSYDEATCRAFKEEYGKGPLELRWHNSGSVLWCEWMRWNAAHVTALVKGVKDLIERSGKPIPFSVAVFPDHESAKILIGQDWERWTDEGIIDVLCPMLYTGNHAAFAKYVRRAVEVGRGKCPVYAGIAVKIARCENTPEELVKQMRISRREGADGVVFFYGADLLDKKFRDRLSADVFGSAPE